MKKTLISLLCAFFLCLVSSSLAINSKPEQRPQIILETLQALQKAAQNRNTEHVFTERRNLEVVTSDFFSFIPDHVSGMPVRTKPNPEVLAAFGNDQTIISKIETLKTGIDNALTDNPTTQDFEKIENLCKSFVKFLSARLARESSKTQKIDQITTPDY